MTASLSIKPVPSLARTTVGLISGILLLSAGGEAAVAIARQPANWSMFGFALVVVLAAGFGLLFAAGKIQDAPVLALACVTGAVIVCSVLGYLGMDRWIVPLSKKWWLMGRGALAAVLLAIAIIVALGENRAGWRSLFVAVAAMVPLAGIAAWYKLAGLAPLMPPADAALGWPRVAGLLVLSAVCLACLCAAIHYGIRAFEIALPPSDAPERA